MKSSQTNTFTGGMQKDLHPMITPPNVLTDALNATIVTMNGNENILQNDMGNAKIESAYLPSGYVPIGMKEHGGIIYIAAYNPLTKKGQVGSFPSPERNIDRDESGQPPIDLFEIFNDTINNDTGKELKSFSRKFSIFNKLVLHPGDKFSLYADLSSVKGFLSNYDTWQASSSEEDLNKKNLISLDFAVSDVNNNLRIITESLKRFDSSNNVKDFDEDATQLEKLNTGYFIQNIARAASPTEKERAKKAVNTFNSRVAGNCYLLETINTVNSIECSVIGYRKGKTSTSDITFTDDNDIALKFTITYKYNCPEIYIAGCKIHFKELNITHYAKKESSTHESYSDGEYQFTETYLMQLKSSSITNINQDITYTVTPCMTFSDLSGAAIKSKINLSKLDSGDINLTTWKYLVHNDRTQLVYGIEAYPYSGQTITNLRIEFTDLFNNSVHTIYIPSKRNYSGVFQEIITIPNNTIYAARLLYNINNDTKTDKVIMYGNNIQYKYLINTPIYNQYFYTVNDFQTLIDKDATNNKKGIIKVPISQTITPEEQIKEPQVYTENIPPLTQNTQVTEVDPCEQITQQRFVYRLTYTPYIVDADNYPLELTEAITVKKESTNASTTVTASTLAYEKEKEIVCKSKVTDSDTNIKTIEINTKYTSQLQGSYSKKNISIIGLFSQVNTVNLFNFKDNTIFWLTFYNFVEGHSGIGKPRPTMTGKVCLTTNSTDTTKQVSENDAYVDAYVWEKDVKHGGDHYRDLLRSDYNIKENVENYAKNNLGSPNILLFSGALKTNSDYNRMSYSSALCKENAKNNNDRYYNYEFLWWKGIDNNYYLLKDFIVDHYTNNRLNTTKSSVQFIPILDTLFSNIYVLGDSTSEITKDLYVLTFGDQDYEKSFNADITIKIVNNALQNNSLLPTFKKDSITDVNITLNTNILKLGADKLLPILEFVPNLEPANESKFVIKTTVKGMEDIYSKVQSIYDTNSISNAALVGDNIISTDSEGKALSINNIYKLENEKLILDQNLNNLFVVINNQIRIKPELTQARKEKYCLYDSTTYGYDSSCEVDIATIPSFSIPNLSFSNNVNKDSLTI